MIRVSNLTFSYDTAEGGKITALSDLSLHVPRGGTCAVIGPSGCGKSTLLRILAGVEHRFTGTVTLEDAPVDPMRHVIGFIPQNYGLLPWKTVQDNIRLSWRVKHPDRSVPPEESEMLSRLGLDEPLLHRFPRELSGGQQQRASLARAFLLQPDVLLMDEPFSALDAITREEMQAVFFSLWHAHNVTTVLVTHYVEEALYLGQRIVVLTAAPGRVASVIENPFFACREESVELVSQKTRLRALLRGTGEGAAL